MKTIKAIAGPFMLMGTLSVFIGICGVIVADRKYVQKNPELQEQVLDLSTKAGQFGFSSLFVTLPICCFAGTNKKDEASA